MNVDLILKNISRHIRLDEAEKDFFVSLLRVKHLKRKEVLFREGEVAGFECFVNKGCLRTYSIDPKGTEHIVMFAIEDWWTSDLYSFLTKTPATFTIDALEESEVLQLSREGIEQLYERVPKFERFFRIMFQNAYLAQQQRINQNLSQPAEERYLRFIAKYPQIEQRVPQKQIASYLGITPEFLSMLRKKRAGR